MRRIRVSKIFQKPTASGAISHRQAVTIDQFPAENYTVWLSASDPKYLHTPGVYQADIVISENKYEKDGKTYTSPRFRFYNLVPLTSAVPTLPDSEADAVASTPAE